MAEEDDVPLLSAPWLNQRIANIEARSLAILMGMLDDLTSSGYLPMEVPRTEEFNARATPEQLFIVENEASDLGFQRDEPLPPVTSGPVV